VPLHVIQRGNNRNACFFGDGDRRLYVQCLAAAAAKHACAIHAYVLMPNHVHLLVSPREGDGVAMMMQEVGRRYVRLFNETHRRTGTLWEGRYKAAMIDSQPYLLTCQRYIELNPVRAALVENPADYPWSSHRHTAYGLRDPLLTPHEIFMSLAQDAPARRAAYVALFADPIPVREVDRIREATNKGWPLGSEALIDQIETALGRPAKAPKRGRKSGGQKSDDLTGCPEMLI